MQRKVPSADQFFKEYYNLKYIAKQKYVICSESEYDNLSQKEKGTIRFIVRKSKTFIKPGIVYVADKKVRGPIAESILKNRKLYVK